MSTHVPEFQSFFAGFLHHFVLAKLATSSIRVSCVMFYNHSCTIHLKILIFPEKNFPCTTS